MGDFQIQYVKLLANGIAELTCEDGEPVECEVVIPVNMRMTMSGDEAIADTLERFRQENPNA
jgi:hypothetical protein